MWRTSRFLYNRSAAMIGAMMVLTGKWSGKGVFNVEEFNPDPFMEMLNVYGLPWKEQVDRPLPVE